MFKFVVPALVAFALSFSMVGLASGAETPELTHPGFDHAIFAFGGRVAENDILAMANPFTADYDDNFAFGAGYQRFILEWPKDLHVGAEIGAAVRFGRSTSMEVWGGAVARYDGLTLFRSIGLSPAFTGGLSAVTGTMKSWERRNAAARDGDATLLFYLGPELNISLADDPATEVFWRLHHRSGAWGTLGRMHGGANIQTIGVRRRF